MPTKQQQEALDYFSRHAADWRAKAENAGNQKVNVIEQRNGFVQQIAKENPALREFLDVGCGTGELVCDVARHGVHATGVDYAPEMIELAVKKAHADGLGNATFVARSIFDFEMPRDTYGLVSANGLIEYISLQEMETLFDRVAEALAPGGSFVVGSRNRLFNLFSLNDFTLQEIESDSVVLLLKEAVRWTEGKDIAEVVSMECAPLQATGTEHGNTFIDVKTRYQYSPFQLINLLQARGLRPVEVYPVHIHGVPPSFKEANREIQVSIANLLQAYARHNTQLLANASTFMLHVKKAE